MQPIQVQGYLLALCQNNMKQYTTLCKMLVSSLVTDSEHSRSVNGDAVLNLANTLKPFEKNSEEAAAIKLNRFDRNQVYSLCKKNTHSPEVIDLIFSKPGVNEKRPV